jgi:hypothetical protein
VRVASESAADTRDDVSSRTSIVSSYRREMAFPGGISLIRLERESFCAS